MQVISASRCVMKNMSLLALFTAGSCLAFVGCNACNPRPNPQPCPQPAPYFPGNGPGPAPMPKGQTYLPEPPIAPVPINSQSKSIDTFGAQKDLAWQPGG